MGNSESNERQLFIEVIFQLLSKTGIKVKKSTIHSFFSFVQEHCPWFPEEGMVNLDTWERVGKQLKTYHAEHGSEKVPNDAFSLWNIIRDDLDPAPESEKVHFKEESEEKTAVKPEEYEKEEDPPDYQQLRKMLAAMTAQEQIKDREEKQGQLSPQDEDLDEIAARYHSDKDWPLLNENAPRSLRETPPIRPSAPRSLREISPIRPCAAKSLQETSPVQSSIKSEHQTVQRAPEYRARDMGPILLPPPPRAGSVGPIPLPPPPRPSAIGPIPRDIGPILKDMGPIPLPPPPYQSGRPPLSAPRGRVFFCP